MTDRRLVRAIPLTVVLVVVAVGLVIVATGHWRRGAAVLGAAAAVGAALRLVVPDGAIGPLGVRGRLFDVGFIGALAVLLLVAGCAAQQPLGVFVELAAWTGARRGEIVGLQWGDVLASELNRPVRRR